MLTAPTVFLDPQMMQAILIYAFAAAVLGGIDSPVGAVVGGLLLGVGLNLIGTYPGSLGNYAGIQRRIPVVTIELPYAETMPKSAEVGDIWRDLVQWLSRNIPAQLPVAGQDPQDMEPS